MKKSFILIYILLIISCTKTNNTNTPEEVHIQIHRQKDGNYRISYEWDNPVSSVSFIKNKDPLMRKNWKIIESEYNIRRVDDRDMIERKDARVFNHFTVLYHHESVRFVPGGYPLSVAFSDGLTPPKWRLFGSYDLIFL